MLADERPQIEMPNLVASVRERVQSRLLRASPGHVDVFGIDRRRAGGEAVQIVDVIRLVSKTLAPQFMSIDGAEAQEIPFRGLNVGAGNEDLVAPQHRRRVAAARQLDLPIHIGVGPLRGNLGFVLPGPVWAAKPRPLLGRRWRHKTGENGESNAADSAAPQVIECPIAHEIPLDFKWPNR